MKTTIALDPSPPVRAIGKALRKLRKKHEAEIPRYRPRIHHPCNALGVLLLLTFALDDAGNVQLEIRVIPLEDAA